MLDRLKLIILLTLVPVLGTACSGNASETQSVATQPVATQPVATQPVKNVVKEQPPVLPAKPTGSAFIVVSKRDQTLSVYDLNAAGDTVMVAQFPCCMGKNKGDKQRRGDMRTPESPAGKPFKITMIQDASTWKHDFKDGRGNIKAYGHWFLRLETPGHKGIGIHGSTNNENTVPGRASEGCIRLLDKDIITLKEHFAYVGMPVTVQPEDQAPLPWEVRARQRKAQ
jgi:lipoprotein-anchoring transpeptidase ErfK/SrfK